MQFRYAHDALVIEAASTEGECAIGQEILCSADSRLRACGLLRFTNGSIGAPRARPPERGDGAPPA
jgi:hypothetical protein